MNANAAAYEGPHRAVRSCTACTAPGRWAPSALPASPPSPRRWASPSPPSWPPRGSVIALTVLLTRSGLVPGRSPAPPLPAPTPAPAGAPRPAAAGLGPLVVLGLLTVGGAIVEGAPDRLVRPAPGAPGHRPGHGRPGRGRLHGRHARRPGRGRPPHRPLRRRRGAARRHGPRGRGPLPRDGGGPAHRLRGRAGPGGRGRLGLLPPGLLRRSPAARAWPPAPGRPRSRWPPAWASWPSPWSSARWPRRSGLRWAFLFVAVVAAALAVAAPHIVPRSARLGPAPVTDVRAW